MTRPDQIRGKSIEIPDYIPYKSSPVANGITSYLVLIPRGICPFKLKDLSKKGIIDWADKVFEECAKSGCILSVHALYFWSNYEKEVDRILLANVS